MANRPEGLWNLLEDLFLQQPMSIAEAARRLGVDRRKAAEAVRKRWAIWSRWFTIEETEDEAGVDLIHLKPTPWWEWARKNDVWRLGEAKRAVAGGGFDDANGRMQAVLQITLTCPGCASLLGTTIPNIMAANTLHCQGCGRQFRALTLGGYLYVLSHRKMPGLVKIGRSEGWPDKRVEELDRETGVPGRFTREAYFASDAPEEHEKRVKSRLHLKRIEGKEFFEAKPEEALRITEEVVGAGRIDPRDRSLDLTPQGL